MRIPCHVAHHQSIERHGRLRERTAFCLRCCSMKMGHRQVEAYPTYRYPDFFMQCFHFPTTKYEEMLRGMMAKPYYVGWHHCGEMK